MSKDLYIPETPTLLAKVVFRLHFLSLVLFLSSRLPSCRIPSCWMDGIHAICLSTKKNIDTESLRGGNRRPPFGHPCDPDIPRYDFFLHSAACTMAAWTQDVSEIQTKIEIRNNSNYSENHCSQVKNRLRWPWWPWEKMRGRTSHHMMLVGDVGV